MLAGRFLGTSNVAFHKFGMGYRAPTPLHLAKRAGIWLPLSMLLEARGATAAVVDNTTGTMPLCGQVFDQGSTGSCTWNSTPKALKISVEGQNVAVASLVGAQDFSQRVGYGAVRQLERGQAEAAGAALGPLTDSGAIPDDCITVVQSLGVAAMGAPLEGRYSDMSTSNVNVEINLADEEKTILATGAYDVDLASPDRVSEWQAAINAKIGLTMAFFVDTQNVMNWNPNAGPITTIDLRDPQGGGHQICGPVAWETSASLGVVWTFLNSWGVGWGENGFLKITDKCLMTSIDSSIAYDIKVTDSMRRAA